MLGTKIGKAKGHMQDKHNRAQKIYNAWDELKRKMCDMIERGHGTTDTARQAYCMLLLMETGVRSGNADSAKGYVCDQKHHELYGKEVGTFGLTTLLPKHITQRSGTIKISFTGKKLVDQSIVTKHPVLVRYIHTVMESHDKPTAFGVKDKALRKFTRKYIGKGFHPKDIRTALVNRLFINIVENDHILNAKPSTKKEANAVLKTLILKVAERIGHTKGVCKSAYLSPTLYQVVKDKLHGNIVHKVRRNKKHK
jgi:DNA topoisomerase IB